jgi:hypothetical protein
MRKKNKPKSRRWRCQATILGKKCPNLALFENGTKGFRAGNWKLPLKVRLCMPCDSIYSGLARSQD